VDALFSYPELPRYHDNMLLVQMRTSSRRGASTASIAPVSLESSAASALSFYERAGMVKRVTPVRSRGVQFIANTLSVPIEISLERPRGRRSESRILTVAGTEAGTVFGVAEDAGGAATALLATAAAQGDQRGGGLSLIELEKGQSVEQLRVALATDGNVESVSKVPIRYLAGRSPRRRSGRPGIAAAPPPPSTMWNLQKIRWAEARAIPGFVDAQKIRVAVLDTGIDMSHPDLAGLVRSYTYLHPDLPGASSDQDIIGHGTHVAGTIAAASNNGVGINGICTPDLHIWKIFDDEPDLIDEETHAEFAYFVDPVMYLGALLDCADARMDVVNLSIGGTGRPSRAEAEAFADLIAGGTTVVAAMGNERQFGSPTSYPAAIPGVVAVGATSLADQVTNFSNRGNHISVCAPGNAIWSTLPTQPGQTGWKAVRGPDGRWIRGAPDRRETDYDAWPGTSMASPHVAAAAALHMAMAGRQPSTQVRAALIAACDKVPAMQGTNFHPDYGYGRINLETLTVNAISSGTGPA
jgi:subtilisin family serine protease